MTATRLAARCIANSKTLDPHRALGFFLTLPGALLFLIVALLAWYPTSESHRFDHRADPDVVQMILPGLGRWGGAFHLLNAIVVLGLFGWLAYRLRHDQASRRTGRSRQLRVLIG